MTRITKKKQQLANYNQNRLCSFFSTRNSVVFFHPFQVIVFFITIVFFSQFWFLFFFVLVTFSLLFDFLIVFFLIQHFCSDFGLSLIFRLNFFCGHLFLGFLNCFSFAMICLSYLIFFCPKKSSTKFEMNCQ